MALEAEDRTRLLELALRSIADGCGRGLPPPVPQESWPAALAEPRAAFVTLKREGELCGCCGTIEPRCSLAEDVWQNAWASAYADPRFPPLSGTEIGLLEVAVSVLSPLETLSVGNDAELLEVLRPGLDGLVLRCGAAGATFLPAVWEIFPDPRDFLTQLKLKAGWPRSLWPQSLTAQRYSTETFHAPTSPSGASDR